MVVGATVVLAGVAVFTALRLYQLRDNGVTPTEPNISGAQESPITVNPSSGDWNLPDMFIVTNTDTTNTVTVVWEIDCFDETACEDTNGLQELPPGEAFESGLGSICSQWQLNLNWTDTTSSGWDWQGVSQTSPACDNLTGSLVEVENLTQEQVQTTDEPNAVALTVGDFETLQCTSLSFSLVDTTGIGGTTETPTPSPSATATPTIAPTPTATPVVTASPTTAPTIAPTQAPELPEAGIGLPTLFGIGIGSILLLAALGLAL